MAMTVSQRRQKRAFDLVVGTIGLMILLPVLLAVALSIKATSPGPILFLQHRTGLLGRPIRVIKFRTMTAQPKQVVEQELRSHDPRITPIGQFLRRSGLDELPQLINVIRGDMSLVGPRPLLQWENDLCDARQIRRLEMPPGMTGLSLINGRNSIPWAERIEWDVAYVEQASLKLDVMICLKSVSVVVLGRNAYAGEHVTLAEPKRPGSAEAKQTQPIDLDDAATIV